MKDSKTLYHLKATLLLIVISSAFTLSSFAQSLNPLFRHLPPNATQVYHINLPALTSKLSWNEIISSIPSKATNDQAMAMVKDPAQAGIDINQDIFITQTEKRTKLDSTGFTTILLHLSDSGKFGLIITLMDKDFHTFRLPQGRAIGKDKIAVAYDNKLAVITFVTPEKKPTADEGKKSLDNRKAPDAVAPNYTLAAAKRSLAALQGFNSSTYTTDPDFIAGFSDDADVHMWAPQGAGLATLLKTAGGKKNQGMTDALTGSTKTTQLHLLTALRFDAGKLSLRTTIALPPDSAAFIKKFNTRPLNTDLIARLPGKELLGMVNLHFDLSVLTDLLEKFKLRQKADSALSGKGFTVSDVQKAFKGDFLLAVLAPATTAGDTSSAANTPAIYFVTTINDLGSFMKVVSKLPLLKDSASGGKGMFGKMKTAYTLKNNILVVSSSKQRTDGYFSNTSRRSTDLVTDRVANAPGSLVVDIKAVAAYLQGAGGPPSGKTQQMLHFMNALDRLTIAGGRLVDGNKSETYVELKMADPSENSLRSIFKLMH